MVLNINLAPIALFAYNRPSHLKETIESLKKNTLAKESILYIFSDGFKNQNDKTDVNLVREYLKTINGFKEVIIIENLINKGLAINIKEGVDNVLEKFDKIIVLEDDLLTSINFLTFMNTALEIYENDIKVCQVNGYSYFEKYIKKFKLPNNFFIKGADCLGWATWKRAWCNYHNDSKYLYFEIKRKKLFKEFNRNNSYDFVSMLQHQFSFKNTSWAINWYAICFLNNQYTLYPSKSLVFHIGNDSKASNYYLNKDNVDPLNVSFNLNNDISVESDLDVLENTNVNLAYQLFLKEFRTPAKPWKMKLKCLINKFKMI
jgi:hypothetical protein